jgi:leader peptidase (prepilin peptidase)/N-methyltransferase
VEALVAAGFLAAWLRFGAGAEFSGAAWLWFACVVLTIIDLRHFILPDLITLSGLAGGLVLAGWRAARTVLVESRGEGIWAWLGGPFDEPVLPLAAVVGALAGAAMPFLARGGYMLIRRRSPGREEPEPSGEDEVTVEEAAIEEGMGLGDVKMLAMVGAFLGARMAFMTILIGSLAGCILVLPWLAFTKRGFRTPVPFGPFLALGAIIVLFAGDAIAGAYADLVRRLIL